MGFVGRLSILFLFLGLSGCTSVFESFKFFESNSNFSFKINSGNAYTNTTQVILSMSYSSKVTHFAYGYTKTECESNLDWQPIKNSFNITLPIENGINTIWAKAKSNDFEEICIDQSIQHDSVNPIFTLNKINLLIPGSGLGSTYSPIIETSGFSDPNSSGIEKIEAQIRLQKSHFVVLDWTPLNSKFQLDALNLSSSENYYISVRAIDKAGNKSQIQTSNPFSTLALTTGISNSVFAVTKLVPIDFDKDGDLDLIASGGDGQVVWFVNNGNASFERKLLISDNALDIKNIEVVDLDGDKDLDIAILINGSNDQLKWIENEGLESFNYHELTSSVATPIKVLSADFDNDGDLDFIVGSYANDTLEILENNGQLAFSSHTIDATLDGFSVFSIADIDKDGDIDIVAGSSIDDHLNWFENTGNNTFTKHLIDAIVESTHQYREIKIVDIDKDGELDIVVASWYINLLCWYKNDGNENFSKQSVSTTSTHMQGVDVADFDNDGNLDFVYISYFATNLLAWGKNNGTQTFSENQLSTNFIGWTNVVSGDFDNDGDIDIVTSESGSGSLSLIKNSGSGSIFTRSPLIDVDDQILSMEPTDLDRDGDTDFVFASQANSYVGWVKNNGSGNFQKLSLFSGLADVKVVYPFDIDGDDDIDIVVGSHSTKTVGWLENDGSGNFSLHVLDNTKYVDSVRAVDLDENGTVDIVASTIGPGGDIKWFKNDGSQNFTNIQLAPTECDESDDIEIIDFDKDNDLDIVCGSSTNLVYSWMENNGSESFTGHDISSYMYDWPRDMEVVDLNQDGYLDVIATSAYYDTIVWLKNDGTQNFTEISLASDVDYIYAIDTIDFDGDGDIDIVGSAPGEQSVFLLENDGVNNFNKKFISQSNGAGYRLFTLDIDGDGKIEVITSGITESGIVVYDR